MFTLFIIIGIAITVPVVLHFREKNKDISLSSKIVFIIYSLLKSIYLLDQTTIQQSSSTLLTTTTTNGKYKSDEKQ